MKILKIDEMVNREHRITNPDLLKWTCELVSKDGKDIVKRIMRGVGVTDDEVCAGIYFVCPTFIDDDGIALTYDDSKNAYFDNEGFKAHFEEVARYEIDSTFGLMDDGDGFFRSVMQTDAELNGLMQGGAEGYGIDIEDIADYFYGEFDAMGSNNVRCRKDLFWEGDGHYIEVTDGYLTGLMDNMGATPVDAKRVIDIVSKEIAKSLVDFRNRIVPEMKKRFLGNIA